ncbi:MAG: sensor histidine kinase [Rhodospirillales bacterium]
MRLHRIQSNLPIIGLTTALVVATAIAGTTFTGLSHQFMSMTGQPIENLYWQLTQLQLEYERAYRLTVEAKADPTPARQAAALRRYEVFASRIPIIVQGIGMERIALYPDTLGHIREIEALIGETDRAMAAAPDRAGKLAAIAGRLEAANRLMLDYAVAAKNTLNAEEDLHIQIEHTLQKRLMTLFFGVALVVLVFAVLAWLQVRRLERSRHSLLELAEQLTEQKSRAETANRAKTNLLANMSHELRTLLNIIIGFAEIVAGETFGRVTPAKYAEYVRDILKSGQYMLGMVGDLLNLAKIETGQATLRPEWLDLHRECVHALRDCDGEAHERGVDLAAAEVPARLFLHADRRALRQMLGVALSNALAFTRVGGRCSIHVRQTEEWLCVDVSDTGVGMSPRLIARLLDPFSEVAEKTVDGMQTSPFGLPLARRLMALHDGDVAIASVEGAGTTVSLKFPARAARQVEVLPQLASDRREPPIGAAPVVEHARPATRLVAI